MITRREQWVQYVSVLRYPKPWRHSRELLAVALQLCLWSQLGVLTRVWLDLFVINGCSRGWGLCLTSQGHGPNDRGAYFADLFSNCLGSFIMGSLAASSTLQLKTVKLLAILPQDHVWQDMPELHIGLRTGYCGSLTTFASWDWQLMQMLLGGWGFTGGQWATFLWGWVVGLYMPFVSYCVGEHLALFVGRFYKEDDQEDLGMRVDEEEVIESRERETEAYAGGTDAFASGHRLAAAGEIVMTLGQLSARNQSGDIEQGLGQASTRPVGAEDAADCDADRVKGTDADRVKDTSSGRTGSGANLSTEGLSTSKGPEDSVDSAQSPVYLHRKSTASSGIDGTRPLRRASMSQDVWLKRSVRRKMLSQWTSGPLPMPILEHLAKESMWQPAVMDQEYVIPLRELGEKVNAGVAEKDAESANAPEVTRAVVGHEEEQRRGCWGCTPSCLEEDPNHFLLLRKTNLLTGLTFLGITATFIALSIADKDEKLAPRWYWVSVLFGPPGCIIRWLLSPLNYRMLGNWDWFPLGTFTANVLACIVNYILGVIGQKIPTVQKSFFLLAVSKGFCGALSTVSTFMAELRGQARFIPQYFRPYTYVFISVCLPVVLGLIIYGSAVL